MNDSLQRGIAIGPILFVIALLAVLASALAAGSGSFTASTFSETAKAKSAALIESGQNLKMGFDRLMANGIDYGNIIIDPTRDSADDELFSPSGGGITPPSTKMGMEGAEWVYTYSNTDGFGPCQKRVAVIAVENATICSEINRQLGNADPPATDIGAVQNNPSDPDDPPSSMNSISLGNEMGRKMAGCKESNHDESEFYFFQVLGIDTGKPTCVLGLGG